MLWPNYRARRNPVGLISSFCQVWSIYQLSCESKGAFFQSLLPVLYPGKVSTSRNINF